MTEKPPAQFKVTQDCYARLLDLLLDGPASTLELVAATGLHIVTVQSLLRSFRRHHVAFISAWEPDSRGRDASPIHSLGRGRNAPRRRQTKAQISQRYHARKIEREMHQALALA